jgi:hypothetical protein
MTIAPLILTGVMELYSYIEIREFQTGFNPIANLKTDLVINFRNFMTGRLKLIHYASFFIRNCYFCFSFHFTVGTPVVKNCDINTCIVILNVYRKIENCEYNIGFSSIATFRFDKVRKLQISCQ